MAGKIEDGGPAFPQFDVVAGERDGHGDLIEAYTTATGGMTLRAYLAAHAQPLYADASVTAVSGLVGRPFPGNDTYGTLEHWQFWAEAEAKWRVMQADAMLAALKGGA